MKRGVKQSIIIIFVLTIVISTILLVKWLLRVKPTCFDQIKNGNEEGIDCGSACNKSCPQEKPEAEALKIRDFQVVEGDGIKCDLVAIIENPNSALGGQHIPYTMTWGSMQKNGEFYIYPGERERYIAEINLPCQKGVTPQIEVKEPSNWQLFREFEKPNLEIITSKSFDPKESNVSEDSYEFFSITGTTINKSPFDLKEIEVYVIIKNSSGKILGINRTTINSILVNEKRDFRLFWTHSFNKEDGSYKFFTTSNLFDSENFMRAFGAGSYQTKDIDASRNPLDF